MINKIINRPFVLFRTFFMFFLLSFSIYLSFSLFLIIPLILCVITTFCFDLVILKYGIQYDTKKSMQMARIFLFLSIIIAHFEATSTASHAVDTFYLDVLIDTFFNSLLFFGTIFLMVVNLHDNSNLVYFYRKTIKNKEKLHWFTFAKNPENNSFIGSSFIIGDKKIDYRLVIKYLNETNKNIDELNEKDLEIIEMMNI